MSKKYTSEGSNLFKIEIDTVLNRIQEANEELLSKANNLFNEVEALNININDDEELKNFIIFTDKLKALSKEISKAKLADSRPFTNATKEIKKWFDNIGNKSKSLEVNLSQKANLYIAKKLQEKQEREREIEKQKSLDNNKNTFVKENNVESGDELYEAKDEEEVLGTDYTGQTIISESRDDNNSEIKNENESVLEDINLSWEIESFDENILDIEKLRKFFSNYAYQQAIKKHLAANGPNQINGVKYKQVINTKAKQKFETDTDTINLNTEEKILYDNLRRVRRSLAKKENVPEYIIFHNKTLQEMSFHKPNNHTDFKKINGVGGTKIKYIDDFLSVISKFLGQRGQSS